LGLNEIFGDVSLEVKSRLQIVIRMDVRISRISPIRTDFFCFLLGFRAGIPKKSVPIGEIREIRTSICIVSFVSKAFDFAPNKVS
jgi:hypothetical protein